MNVNINLATALDTTAQGKKLAIANQQQAITVYLLGELGAGKTTFAKGVLAELGYIKPIKSPTYSLVESYSLAKCTVHHFDLYRLADPEELEYIGIRDYFDENSINLIEWPNKGREMLPSPDLIYNFNYLETGRYLILSAQSSIGEIILNKIKLSIL